MKLPTPISTSCCVALVWTQIFVAANSPVAVTAFTQSSFWSRAARTTTRNSAAVVVDRPPQQLFANRHFHRSLSATDKDDEETSVSGKPSWLKEAMGDTTTSDGLQAPPIRMVSKLEPGISGFSVDPSLGFCVILAGGNDKDSSKQQRATYAVIAPTDTNRVSTPEALCVVQLAGGLDLGTGVLPPDALAQLLAADEATEEEEDDGKSLSIEDIRQRSSLVQIDVVPNEDGIIAAISDKEKDKQSDAESSPVATFEPARNDNIVDTAPKVHDAVKRLPGLGDVSLEDVVSSMKRYSNEKGNVDRDAFAQILEHLRDMKNNIQPSLVKFQLTVNLVSENSVTQRTLEDVSPFMAIGLAMRYNTVPLVISQETLENGFDADEILERFPAFRPLEELEEDAKIMDGFIPSMFMEASKPPPGNDQKL